MTKRKLSKPIFNYIYFVNLRFSVFDILNHDSYLEKEEKTIWSIQSVFIVFLHFVQYIKNKERKKKSPTASFNSLDTSKYMNPMVRFSTIPENKKVVKMKKKKIGDFCG